MTKSERLHMERVAGLPCAVSNQECAGRPTVHHCLTGMGRRKNHFDTICLCFRHHLGDLGIDGKRMGKRVWEQRYSTEEQLLAKTREALGMEMA